MERPYLNLVYITMVAALGLMGIAGAARASEGEWLKGGRTFAEAGIEEEEAAGSIEGGELLTAGGIKIACAAGQITATLLRGGTAEFSVLFAECTLPGNPHCPVLESEGTVEHHITTSGLAELSLHGGSLYLLDVVSK